MSLYSMVFGQNGAADAILATLGLTRESVGRFRDCFVAKGEIAVYTRNGGGNRSCWHEGDSDEHGYGSAQCKQHSFERAEDEYTTSGLIEKTGRRVTVTRYVCDAPRSAACACPGCTIEYRLPKHACCLRDEDDDFDCTYATIYFRFPDEYAEELRKLDSGEKFEPSERWLKAIEALRAIQTTENR